MVGQEDEEERTYPSRVKFNGSSEFSSLGRSETDCFIGGSGLGGLDWS